MHPFMTVERLKAGLLMLSVFLMLSCAKRSVPANFHDPQMDFSALRTVAVMPLSNLTRDQLAGDRVRDTFINSLMATGVLYVVPPGEVARGISRANITDPAMPSKEDIARIAAVLQADAVLTGVVREYGEIRSGATSANAVSVGMQMFEAKTQRVVWTASSTRGGITVGDRLLGSGGRPMNEVTQAAVNDLIGKLLY